MWWHFCSTVDVVRLGVQVEWKILLREQLNLNTSAGTAMERKKNVR